MTTTEPPRAEHQIVYCYDGSDHAREALVTAAKSLGASDSVVVTVWQSGWVAVAAAPYAFLPGDAVEKIDVAAKNAAQALADEGATLVPGAAARPLESAGSVWRTVLDFADECDAELVVVGSGV